MKSYSQVTPEELERAIVYDPVTGLFKWVQPHNYQQAKGWFPGSATGNGYLRLWLAGRHYLAHRIAWMWMTDEWPREEIDHKDGNGSNNVWTNLRLATRTQQLYNSAIRTNNTTGVKGIDLYDNCGFRYRARIAVNGVRINLGDFNTLEEATAARQQAEEVYHGAYARR